MNALEANRIVKRVISEVAGTIVTNGIWELSHVERGGVSEFGYVQGCLISTAYNAVRALPGFNHSYSEFFTAVEAEVARYRYVMYGNAADEVSR
jgi:hypothetical protein